MKNLLICLTLFLISVSSWGQHFEKASDYHNFIMGEQTKLLEKIIEFNTFTAYNNNHEENNQKRLDIIYQINFSLERLNALETFKGDSRLKDHAIEVFQIYKEAYNIEFNEVNELRKLREHSFEDMEKYCSSLDKAEDKLKAAGDKFFRSHSEFAKKHNITVRSSEIQTKLDDQWLLNRHIRHVYLEFFRVYKADELFMNAMNNQDTDNMEKRRLEIIKGADITYTNLKSLQLFRDDSSFVQKTLSVIQYHKNIAEKEYQDLISILKKGNSMINDDINTFNRIATEVNTKSQIKLSEFNASKREMMKRYTSLE